MMNNLNEQIIEYCNKYNIPVEYLLEILEDQKVVPMIRGKATEYNALSFFEKNLSKYLWSVQKLNLNAQTGSYDEDVSITHRKSGIILKVECKNAVRGSFKDGRRSRIFSAPYFSVKCHRSRSNLSLASTSNDKYSVNDFDLIASNTSNALYKGNTIDTLEVIDNEQLTELLFNYYDVSNTRDLINSCNNDWRFCVPTDIADENGFIPRTPFVLLQNDPNWVDISKLDEKLIQIVKKRKLAKGNSRR